MATGTNVGNLIATLGLDTKDFDKGVERANSDMGSLKGKLGELAGYISTVLTNPVGAAVAALTALATAAVAVGQAALEAAQQFQEAANAIRIGTGATGEAFDQLNAVMLDINGTVASSTQDIGTAIADLNTAYGLQGEELESLSRQYLALAQVTGMDVSTAIEKARAVFNKFGVEVEDQSNTLDYFLRISQQSGVSMDQLLSILDSADRGFQLLGLSVEEAAAVIGTAMAKDGVEAAQELASGLERAASQAVEKWGSDSEAQKGLRETLALMKQAGDETQAAAILTQQTGLSGRFAATVAGAAMGGALDYGDLMAAASSGDTLQALARETETLDQKMQKLGAATQEALLPIGNLLDEGLKKLAEMAIPLVEQIGKDLEYIGDIFTVIYKNNPFAIFERVLKVILENKQVQEALRNVMDAFNTLRNTISGSAADVDIFAGIINILATILINVVVPALNLVAEALNFLTDSWKAASEIWHSITEGIGTDTIDLFGGLFDGLDEMLYGWITGTVSAWETLITSIVSTTTNGIAGVVDMWDSWLDGMLDILEGWGQSVVDFFVDIWNNLIQTTEDSVNALLNNTGLGSFLGFFGLDTSLDLSGWQLTAPTVEIARSDALANAADSIRGFGTTINQTVNITTDKVVDALEAQRGIERASRDLVRSGV